MNNDEGCSIKADVKRDKKSSSGSNIDPVEENKPFFFEDGL